VADRSFYPSQSYGIGRVYLEVGFTLGGGSAPALSSVYGADAIASFAHTGATNIITVTLKDKFNKVVDANISILGGIASGDWGTVDTISNEASSTTAIVFTIKTFAAAGGAQNDETGRMGVTMAFRNTKQQPGAGAV